MVKAENSLPRMLTIREVARTGLLPENCLRQMEKRGELPCIYAGNRCLINLDLLVDQLNHLGGGGANGEP